MSELALDLARKGFGPTSHGVIHPNRTLGWILYAMGSHDEAVAQFEESARVNRAVLEPMHIFVGMDLAGLGASLRSAGRIGESNRVLEDALKSWGWGGDPTARHPPTFTALQGELGLTLNVEARFEEAESVLRETLGQYDRAMLGIIGTRVFPRGRVECGLGVALAGQGKFQEAEPHLLHAFSELQSQENLNSGDAQRITRETREALVAFYTAWDRPDQAAEWQARFH